tara:strand:- start:26297 stop:27418 length:1122 start_codon:yes stop_codon:yes gene_type:complete
MKKAIIFGITGQDGSYLAELLLSRGYKVVGVTRRVSVNTLTRISHILPKIKIVEGDVTDGFNVSKIIEEHKPDEVYNLAAQSHVKTSFDQVHLTSDVTYSGLVNILEAIRYSSRKNEIKLYQANSSEMFGKNYTEKIEPIFGKSIEKYQDENTAFVPQSPYAVAKRGAHDMIRIYRDSYGIHASSGILFNHESERRGELFVTRKITKWIGEFAAWMDSKDINADQLVTVDQDEVYIPGRTNKDQGFQFPKLRLGNIDARRDWGHAKDYVEAMWLMLQQEVPDDYVVATGETHSVREFLEVAFSVIGIDDWEQYIVIDPEFYRPAEVDYLLGKPDKAKQKLGWKPKISFKELTERMVKSDVEAARLQRSCLQGV